MAKLAFILLIVLAASDNCSGQLFFREDNPVKYALIHHEPNRTNRGLDQSALQYAQNVEGYQNYVAYVVLAYKSLFSLNKAQESTLHFALARLYRNEGVTIAEVHAAVVRKFMEKLSFSQYLDWKQLESYPEDTTSRIHPQIPGVISVTKKKGRPEGQPFKLK